MRKMFFTAWLAILPACASLADITVTTDATIKMMGVSLGDIRSVQMIKGNKLRTVTERPAIIAAFEASEDYDDEFYEIICLDDKAKWTVYPKDSTYVGTLMENDDVNSVPLVGDQQSLDSALAPDKSQIVWAVDSLKKSKDTCLSILCRIIQSSATGRPQDSKETMSASCEIWIPENDSILADMIRLNQKVGEIAGLDDGFTMELYGGLISNFGVTFQDLALDTVQGIPMKIDFELYVSLTENDIPADFDPDETADALASQKALADAMENVNTRSGADTLEVSGVSRDAMTDIFAQLLTAMKGNLKPGRMELFGFSMEITDIDTTPLPDSLFDIPEGYTKR